MLLVAGYRAPPDAENIEELVVEALRLALLVRRVPPLVGESGGTGTNFVPGQAHGLKVFHKVLRTAFEGGDYRRINPQWRARVELLLDALKAAEKVRLKPLAHVEGKITNGNEPAACLLFVFTLMPSSGQNL